MRFVSLVYSESFLGFLVIPVFAALAATQCCRIEKLLSILNIAFLCFLVTIQPTTEVHAKKGQTQLDVS